MSWLNSYYYCTADSDYGVTSVLLTFMPADENPQPLCRSIPIFDDSIANEPVEEFSMILTDAVPIGIFADDTSCIAIVDNDSK